jgi:hypothetical protein
MIRMKKEKKFLIEESIINKRINKGVTMIRMKKEKKFLIEESIILNMVGKIKRMK